MSVDFRGAARMQLDCMNMQLNDTVAGLQNLISEGRLLMRTGANLPQASVLSVSDLCNNGV